MSDEAELPVAVAVSRSTLDLAINFWIPGHLARTVVDAEEAVELTRAGGVVVLDPEDPLTPAVLRAIDEHGVAPPIVVLGDDAQHLAARGPVPTGPVVCASRQVEDLARALSEARQGSPVPHADGRSDAAADGEQEGRDVGATDAPSPEGVAPVEDLFEATGEGADSAADPDAAAEPSPRSDAVPDGVGGSMEEPVREEHGSRASPAYDTVRGRPVTTWSAHGSVPGGDRAARDDRRPRRADRRAARPGSFRAWLDRIRGRGGPATRPEDVHQDRDATAHPVDGRGAAGSAGGGTQPAKAGRVIELEPDLDANIDLEPWRIARTWLLLEALNGHVRSGAALVAVRGTTDSFSVVAGVGIAPAEADHVIPANHPVLEQLASGQEWWVRPGAARTRGQRLPLEECAAMLVIAVPGRGQDIDALVLLGRLDTFPPEEARAAAEAVRELERVPSRLRRFAAEEPADSRGPGADAGQVPAFTVRSGWRLLDAVFPLLGGASAALLLRGASGAFVPTAATGLDPRDVASVLPSDHPFLARLAAAGGPVTAQSAGDDAQAASQVPVAHSVFIALVPRGPADDPDAILVIGRRTPFSDGELAELQAAVAAHEPWPARDLAEHT